MMIRASLAVLFLVLCAAPAVAQNGAPVEYRVSFENAAHHEATIAVTFRDIGDEPLVVRMSRSSPGRYALHEFAKNVYAVSAVNGDGAPLSVARRDPYSWRVADHGGEATVTYTLYADRADGTYSQIDRTHAHLNAPATFMWGQGFEDRPIIVTFTPPDRTWRAATQLQATRRAMTFRAPDLYYFLDSPVLLSDFDMRAWTIGEGADQQTIRLVVNHPGNEEDVDIFAEKAKNVVAEQIKLFGEAPDFDYGEYTFIANYTPYVSGDGMEHRNSTILTRTDSLYEGAFAHLGTLSHEFIHAWNVERLRPAELEPFDFTRANPTTTLWFAEGFTSYYGPLTIRRAGESTIDDFLKTMAGRLNSVVHAPGRQFASPMGMSLQAPFTDAATSIDPFNRANSFVSYYPYGAVIALALDLSMRQTFPDATLDDYMRYLWRTFGIDETPYTHDDLREALATVTGDTTFADSFFANYIEDSGLPDLEALFAQAGLSLRPKNEGDAWLGGAALKEDGRALIVNSNTLIGSPLYDAGVDRGDQIIRIGRFLIDNKRDWDRALKRHKPGDVATIVYRQRGGDREAEITFAEDPALEIVRFETADRDLTEAQKAFREAWLGAEKTE
ncbi:MAG: M61 family metallopeptidase [Hyphococcus sp.]